ncbi:EamA family transporter [Vulcanisaeta sp. SCGC AB-777_J10]|nr:EamA family transporter [Vulcanisaeta sp. SCGC AB-777_J10]
MLALNALPAFTTAFIWAWASIVYGDFMKSINPLTVNFLRMLYASLILLIPAIVFGFNAGAVWGSLSGLLSLAVGDSLYLMSINYSGVSIAAPVSYTYIPIAVLMATLLGEPLTIYKVVSGLLVVLGVYLLSRERTRITIRGMALALGAAMAWAVGQTMIKVADISGLNPITLAFTRVATAGVVLLVINYVTHNDIAKAVKSTVRTRLPLFSVLDLGVGVALYAYSMDLVGLGLTVILTGSMPLIAQVMSSLMGREKLTVAKLLGAVVIVLAITIIFL